MRTINEDKLINIIKEIEECAYDTFDVSCNLWGYKKQKKKLYTIRVKLYRLALELSKT